MGHTENNPGKQAQKEHIALEAVSDCSKKS